MNDSPGAMKDSDIMKDNVRQAKRLPIAALFHAVGDILQETVDDISKRNTRAKAIQGGAATHADIVSSSSSSDEDDEEEERVQTQFDDGKIDRFTGVKFEAGSLHVKTMFSDATQAWLPMSKIDIQYDARMRDFLKNFRGSPGNGNGNKVTAKMARDSWREHVRHEECLQGQEVVDVGEEAPPMQWEVVVKKEEGSTPSSKRAMKSPPVGRRVKLTKITPSPADRSFAIKKTPVPSQKTAAGAEEKPAPSAGKKTAPASEEEKPAPVTPVEEPAAGQEKPAAGQGSGSKPVPSNAQVAAGLDTLQRMLNHMATMGFTPAQIAESMAAQAAQKKT
eukprot:jgi/Mesvir1/25848/Mv18204-RA.1